MNNNYWWTFTSPSLLKSQNMLQFIMEKYSQKMQEQNAQKAATAAGSTQKADTFTKEIGSSQEKNQAIYSPGTYWDSDRDAGGSLGVSMTQNRNAANNAKARLLDLDALVEEGAELIQSRTQERDRVLAGQWNEDELRWIEYAKENHPEIDMAAALRSQAQESLDDAVKAVSDTIYAKIDKALSLGEGSASRFGKETGGAASEIARELQGNMSRAGMGLDKLDFSDANSVKAALAHGGTVLDDIAGRFEDAYRDAFGKKMRKNDTTNPTTGAMAAVAKQSEAVAISNALNQPKTVRVLAPGEIRLPADQSQDPKAFFDRHFAALERGAKVNEMLKG